MSTPLWKRYAHWLHLRWPAGKVERLPEVREDGTTLMRGVRIVGDLTGVPLLKFAADSGARAAAACAGELRKENLDTPEGAAELAIVGGGVAGMAAALEAGRRGVRAVVFEAAEPFATVVNFPRAKPIFLYPETMRTEGGLRLAGEVKESLLEELEAQRRAAGIEPRRVKITRLEAAGADGFIRLHHEDGEPFRARRVIVAIGRSGEHRKLGVLGEELPKVFNRLHDPAEFTGKRVLVVGGGDSALEAALALARAGAETTLAHRGIEFSRAKVENVEALAEAGVRVRLGARVERIAEDAVVLARGKDGAASGGGGCAHETLENDVVFTLVGREAPLDFFRRSGLPVRGEGTWLGWAALVAFLLLCVFVYSWKGGGPMEGWIDPRAWADGWREAAADRSTVLGTLAVSAGARSFYYTLLYSLAILAFGIDRMRRRRTPYVRRQTWTLIAVQWLPLFLLPELLLPWAGYNGFFSGGGVGEALGDALFEKYIPTEVYAAGIWPEWGHPRAYWRAYGFILAWPLNVYNTFTAAPHWWWLGIGAAQTFVLIPWLVWRWGKGAYCGWICSCGGLAETVGDRHRQKMPHGPFWNRLNFVGQAILALAFALLGLRLAGWLLPGSWADTVFPRLLEGKNAEGDLAGVFIFSYKWGVDVLLGGILGVGLYFKYSGRVWCRFACPLAALMHIYARFSRFRIFPDKKKCISCGICTSVCHQGIDVMSFANRGLPMEDPQCVRCSACVQVCPTSVLAFGSYASDGRIELEKLSATQQRLHATNEASQ
jgi:thioredoxin reductase/Fe-S-cluster-containing hydrogenase component 2